MTEDAHNRHRCTRQVETYDSIQMFATADHNAKTESQKGDQHLFFHEHVAGWSPTCMATEPQLNASMLRMPPTLHLASCLSTMQPTLALNRLRPLQHRALCIERDGMLQHGHICFFSGEGLAMTPAPSTRMNFGRRKASRPVPERRAGHVSPWCSVQPNHHAMHEAAAL
jgi:hypothetical protein